MFFKSSLLKVHLVIFHQVKNFMWVGQLPKIILKSFKVHYGLREEIYDPFSVEPDKSYNYPSDIFDFLSQISTSQYIHCPPERIDWFKSNNIFLNDIKISSSKMAIISTKSLMKDLKMQFWIACGTLLGKE